MSLSECKGSCPNARDTHPELGWYNTAWSSIPVRTATLYPNVSRTLALKMNYLIDIRVIRPGCFDFPDALWTAILLNQHIDLDWVYAG